MSNESLMQEINSKPLKSVSNLVNYEIKYDEKLDRRVLYNVVYSGSRPIV